MLVAFDHVNVLTSNLEGMIAWYEDVLGLSNGKRPNFPFPGAWMYLGETAIVHLVARDTPPQSIDPGIEHFAIRAKGYRDFVANLETKEVPYQISDVPGFGIRQLNIHDVDGNHIHIDFDMNVEGLAS